MRKKALLLLLLLSTVFAQVIVVGDENYPPFEWVNEQGEYVGFNVDLMKAVALKMNISLEFKPMKWADAVESVKNGSADIIQGIKYSEERSEFLDFAKPSLVSDSAIFTKKDDYTINSVESLEGKTVAVQKGDYSYGLLENVSGISLVVFDDYEQALTALEQGKADAFMGGRYAALYFINKDKFEDLKIAKKGISPNPYGIAVKKGSFLLPEINHALNQLEKDGTKQMLLNKWFGEEISPNNGFTRVLMIWLLIFTVTFIAFNFFYYEWTRSLEKKVKERTEELENSRKELLKTFNELERAYEKMKEKDKEKTEFIRVISHELKTPATIMTLNMELLEGLSNSKKQKQVINRVKKAVIRLNKTIENILEFEKARSVKLESKVKLKDAIRESISEVKPLASAKSLAIRKKIKDSPVVKINKKDLERVLTNLLTNAINFDDKGPVEVIVTTREKEAIVEVRDHGIGLSEKELEKIFTPFFKASPEKSGTGIGLSIAKKIVETYGGRIWAESKGKGKGSSFFFTLPLA